jgi:hypothetical protein
MVSFSIPVRFSRATTAVLALVAVLLMSSAGVARADQPTVLDEDQTGFSCEYRAEGEPQIDVSINFDAVTGTGESSAQVLSPDGEDDLARGRTEDVQVSDGVISARYPLLQYPDGPVIGEVILEGTYVPSGETETVHLRYQTARNAQIIGTTTSTPLEVTWTTLQVGDYDLSGITCEGDRIQTSNRVLQPHRLVGTFSELRLLDNCATDPLTRFEVTASEDGVSLVLAVEGYEGSTNLNLADGSDTQSVEWYNEDGDLAEITSITVSVTENGRRRSIVQTTPDGLILEQIQPLALSYELVLPNQAGTITGECAAESVVTRTAVEPVEE